MSNSDRRKSSYSGGNGGNCVAVGTIGADAVYVEDTKQDHRAVQDRLVVSPDAWRRALKDIKTGDILG